MKKHFELALEKLHDAFEKDTKMEFNWFLIGSAAKEVRGEKVNVVNDIDIITTNEDILKIQRLLPETLKNKVSFDSKTYIWRWQFMLPIEVDSIPMVIPIDIVYEGEGGPYTKTILKEGFKRSFPYKDHCTIICVTEEGEKIAKKEIKDAQ